MSGILKLGGVTLGTENNGTVDLSFNSTNHSFTLKAVDEPIVGANYNTNDDANSGQLAIYNGATKLWGINESGWVQNPNVPCFSYSRTSSYSTASSYIKNSETERVNIGNHYDNTTGLFTVPITANYLFFFRGMSNGNGHLGFYKNGSSISSIYYLSGQGQWVGDGGSIMLSLSAGDYVGFYLVSGNVYSDSSVYIEFGGFLLG